ncbi:hypothetical protein BBF96_12945 [Anoxybacter fermentans]|uniref:CAAX prenyl protease 2/Lysostaphin resistance protein A-like domain-containing protein n=1 Tax=Anoxybacter fermentans TaxID=1323375 RepID=A0A3S9T0Y6_9FIRM|nr:CPBP family intramembrane glutamic endopeptidase [Anoxybacter fermentans]AZR74224.1 hypothetical protein BBF96_12945 [Anoxybacter fermentans]
MRGNGNLKVIIVISQSGLLLFTLGFYYFFNRTFITADFWKGKLNLLEIVYYGFLAGIGIRLFSLILSEVWSEFKNNMEETVINILKGIDNYDLLLISLPPAFIEELFFRGLLQSHLGIWLTSVIFAILHWGFIKKLWAHGLYAFLISLFLGWLYLATSSLLITVIVHFTNNFMAGLYIQKRIAF